MNQARRRPSVSTHGLGSKAISGGIADREGVVTNLNRTSLLTPSKCTLAFGMSGMFVHGGG